MKSNSQWFRDAFKHALKSRVSATYRFHCSETAGCFSHYFSPQLAICPHVNKAGFETGKKGTKKLYEKYGPSLVCVRYRYDTTGTKRYKTVELIEEETEWTPPVKENAEPTDEIVGIRVGYKETKLQGRLKKEGAKWDPLKKVWVVGLAKAEKMELRDRIVVRNLGDDRAG